MARPGRSPRQVGDGESPAVDGNDVAVAGPTEPTALTLMSMLAHRSGDSAAARGALDAIAQALQDLKARTASVAQHLGPNHIDVIQTIKTL